MNVLCNNFWSSCYEKRQATTIENRPSVNLNLTCSQRSLTAAPRVVHRINHLDDCFSGRKGETRIGKHWGTNSLVGLFVTIDALSSRRLKCNFSFCLCSHLQHHLLSGKWGWWFLTLQPYLAMNFLPSSAYLVVSSPHLSVFRLLSAHFLSLSVCDLSVLEWYIFYLCFNKRLKCTLCAIKCEEFIPHRQFFLTTVSAGQSLLRCADLRRTISVACRQPSDELVCGD